MSEYLQKPRLRSSIDVRFHEHSSGRLLVLQCNLGVSRVPLALVAAVAPLVSCFEGKETVEAIAEKYAKFGVTTKLVQDLVQLLEENYFLETPRFWQEQAKQASDFRVATERAPYLAGLGYSGEAALLQDELKRYLSLAQGNSIVRSDLIGLMAPHIDYRRGQHGYGHAYSNFKADEQHTIVLIGTAHQYSRGLFHLSSKDFLTPLGPLRADRNFIGQLAGAYGLERSFRDELLHKREHSLELQTPFLAMLAPQTKIAPILVGSFHNMLSSGKYPQQYEVYAAFVSALEQSCRSVLQQNRKLILLAGVDMAHVGKFFGDSQNLSTDFLEKVEERDRNYLDCIVRADKKALFDHVAEDQDARRICGFPSMYTVLDLFERLGLSFEAQLFDYRQAVDLESQCAVTFASLGMYAQPQFRAGISEVEL